MPRCRSRRILAAVALFVLALLPRLFFLDKTFDHDEMAAAEWAMAPSAAATIDLLRSPFEGNSAGYPLFLHFWAKASLGEVWLRLPSALATAGTAALLFLEYAGTYSAVAAFLGAWLWSLSFFSLQYGQYARPYALYGLFCVLCLVAYRRFAERAGPHWGITLALSAFAALSLHHFAILYVGPLLAATLWRARKEGSRWPWPPVAAVALYAPQLPLFLFQFSAGPRWISSLTAAELFRALGEMVWMHSLAGTVLVIALGLLGYRAWREIAWSVFPILALALVSLLYRPVFGARFFFPGAATLFVPVMAGTEWLARRFGRIAYAIPTATGALAILGMPTYYALPKADDWRGAAAFISAHAAECGSVIVTSPYQTNRWPFYLGERFEMRHWLQPLPTHPYWLASVGHASMPDIYRNWGEHESTLRWYGASAVVYCAPPAR